MTINDVERKSCKSLLCWLPNKCYWWTCLKWSDGPPLWRFPTGTRYIHFLSLLEAAWRSEMFVRIIHSIWAVFSLVSIFDICSTYCDCGGGRSGAGARRSVDSGLGPPPRRLNQIPSEPHQWSPPTSISLPSPARARGQHVLQPLQVRQVLQRPARPDNFEW